MSAVGGTIHGGFILHDSGVEAARYNVSGLTNGSGRWVLDQLETVSAARENTRTVGDVAIVTGGDGARFGYRFFGDRWRLMTMWRPPAGTR
jgi:hypothetical protein